MNEQSNMKEEKIIRESRLNFGKVALVAVGVGAVYMLGLSKGMQIGRTLGQYEGYSKATTYFVEVMRQAVNRND